MTASIRERAPSMASQSAASSLFRFAGGCGWEVDMVEARDRSFAGVEVIVGQVGEGAARGVQRRSGGIE